MMTLWRMRRRGLASNSDVARAHLADLPAAANARWTGSLTSVPIASLDPERADPRLRPALHRLQAPEPAAARIRRRLARLLNDPARPVQLVLAGKAHPDDSEGKDMIRDWIAIAQRPELPPSRRLPRGLRHHARAGAGPGRRCLDQHAAPPLGGLRHERHEGAGQWRPQSFGTRRLVGGGLCARARLGDRRRPGIPGR